MCDLIANPNTKSNEDFPFYLENMHMDIVEVKSDALTLPPTQLLKCSFVLTLFGKSPVTVKALIESGS